MMGDWERVTPVGRLEPVDVITALLDASVSCLLVTIGSGFTIIIVNSYTSYDVEWWVAPGAGLAVALLRYFDGLKLAKSLLQIIESLSNKDIDGDGHIGEPPPQVVRVELKREDSQGARWQFAELRVEPAKLLELAKAIRLGESFAERTATKAGLTQEEFKNLRDIFLDRGWAVWNHPTRKQQGVALTRGGDFIFRQIINNTPLPSSGVLPAMRAHGRTQQHAAGEFEFIEE
jgi:hypothetical protein